jgi:hypothetical protein
MRRHRMIIAAGVLRRRRFVGRGVFWHGKFDDWSVKPRNRQTSQPLTAAVWPEARRAPVPRVPAALWRGERRRLRPGSVPCHPSAGLEFPMGSTELGVGGPSPLPSLLTPNPSATLMTLTPPVAIPNLSAPVSTLGSTPTTGTSPLAGTGTPSIEGRATSFGLPLPTRPF